MSFTFLVAHPPFCHSQNTHSLLLSERLGGLSLYPQSIYLLLSSLHSFNFGFTFPLHLAVSICLQLHLRSTIGSIRNALRGALRLPSRFQGLHNPPHHLCIRTSSVRSFGASTLPQNVELRNMASSDDDIPLSRKMNGTNGGKLSHHPLIMGKRSIKVLSMNFNASCLSRHITLNTDVSRFPQSVPQYLQRQFPNLLMTRWTRLYPRTDIFSPAYRSGMDLWKTMIIICLI